jgi:hypothetical protein
MKYVLKLVAHTANVVHRCCWFLVGIGYIHVAFVSVVNVIHLQLLVPSSDVVHFGLYVVRME